jgi:hypothetical protein
MDWLEGSCAMWCAIEEEVKSEMMWVERVEIAVSEAAER